MMESTNERHWYRKRETAKLQWCNTLLTAEYWVDLRENTGCNQELYINYDQLWQSWERDEITWQFPAFFPHSKLCIGYNYQAALKPTSQGGRCSDSQESLATDIIDAVMDALLKPLLKRMKDRRGSPWRLHQLPKKWPNKWDELQKTNVFVV